MHKNALFFLSMTLALFGITSAQSLTQTQVDALLNDVITNNTATSGQTLFYANLPPPYSSQTPPLAQLIQAHFQGQTPATYLNSIFTPANLNKNGDVGLFFGGNAIVAASGVTPSTAGISVDTQASVAAVELATAAAYAAVSKQPGVSLPIESIPYQAWTTTAVNAVASMSTTEPNYGEDVGALLGGVTQAMANLPSTDVQTLLGNTNAPSFNTMIANWTSNKFSVDPTDPGSAVTALTSAATISAGIANNATGANATNANANLTLVVNTGISKLLAYPNQLDQFASTIYNDNLMSPSDLSNAFLKVDPTGRLFPATAVLATLNDVKNGTDPSADLQNVNNATLSGQSPLALQIALGSVLSLGQGIANFKDPTALIQSTELAILQQQPFFAPLLPAWEKIQPGIASGSPYYAVLHTVTVPAGQTLQSALTDGWSAIFAKIQPAQATSLLSNLYNFNSLNNQADQDPYNIYQSLAPAVQNANLFGSLSLDTQASFTAAGFASAASHYGSDSTQQNTEAPAILGLATNQLSQLNVSGISTQSSILLVGSLASLSENADPSIIKTFNTYGDKITQIVKNFDSSTQSSAPQSGLVDPVAALLGVITSGSANAQAALTELTTLATTKTNGLSALSYAAGALAPLYQAGYGDMSQAKLAVLQVSNVMLANNPQATMPSTLLTTLNSLGFTATDAKQYSSFNTWYLAQPTTSNALKQKNGDAVAPQKPSQTTPTFK